MAPSAKHFPFLLLFFALLSSLHSHARESYFFNKATTTTTTPTKNAKESTVEEVMPNKSNTQEQDPNFNPDTQSGYGLFGQNSGRDPTTATATTKATRDPPYTTTNLPYTYNTVAYVTDPQGMSRDTRFTGRNYATTTAATKTTRIPPYTATNLPYNYNPEAYVTDPQGMSRDTRFTDSGYTTTTAKTTRIPPYTTTNYLPYETESAESYPATTINNNNNNYYDKEAYVTDPQGMTHDTRFIDAGYTNADASNNHYNGGGSRRNYNTEQQGMSDTRFLENGRYFYDINSEQNYPNGYQNSRIVTHNNRGYYGNYNENNDSVKGGYENEDGHEFQESEEKYVP